MSSIVTKINSGFTNLLPYPKGHKITKSVYVRKKLN